MRERPTSNACHAVRDGDGGEGGAIAERIISNACHAVRDGNGSEGGAIIERLTSNACHAVSSAVVVNRFRNGDNGEIAIVVLIL